MPPVVLTPRLTLLMIHDFFSCAVVCQEKAHSCVWDKKVIHEGFIGDVVAKWQR